MEQIEKQEHDKLVILWTSRDREVALNMIFMYALNSKMRQWWQDIELIVWGPSAKLIKEDQDIQMHIKKMIEIGIEVVACRACADGYQASEELEKLGIDVKYMGEPLTQALKAGYKTITI